MPRDESEYDARKEGTYDTQPPGMGPARPARVKFKLRIAPVMVQCPRCEGTGIESGTTLGCRACGGGGEVGRE